MMNNERGFNLVELLIVVVIIGILAMIGVPAYNSQVQKTRRSDATIALMRTAQELERCFIDNDSYAAAAGCNNYAAGVNSPDGYYTIKSTTQSATAFTLTAAAPPGTPQADDTDCAIFSITNTGVKTATNSFCW